MNPSPLRPQRFSFTLRGRVAVLLLRAGPGSGRSYTEASRTEGRGRRRRRVTPSPWHCPNSAQPSGSGRPRAPAGSSRGPGARSPAGGHFGSPGGAARPDSCSSSKLPAALLLPPQQKAAFPPTPPVPQRGAGPLTAAPGAASYRRRHRMCSLQGSAFGGQRRPPAAAEGRGQSRQGAEGGHGRGQEAPPSRIRVAAACCCRPAGRGEASPGPPAPEAGRAGPRLRSRRPPLAASLPPSFLPLQPPRVKIALGRGAGGGGPRRAELRGRGWAWGVG